MKVELDPAVRHRIVRHLRSAGSREIGGILLGEQLGHEHFRIVDISVDSETGSRAHFVRSVDHHTSVLSAFFERTGHDYSRFNYLGEWHSHPSFPVNPSTTDFAAMKSLVMGERDIHFAFLMIVRLDWYCSFKYSMTLFKREDMLGHDGTY